MSGYSLYRIRAPVGSDITKYLSSIGQLMSQQHTNSIQGVIFGGHRIGLANPVPVERRVEDRLGEIAIGVVIRPLPLALKARGDSVMAHRFFFVVHFTKSGIAHHQIAGDKRHLHRSEEHTSELHSRFDFGLSLLLVKKK